MARILYTGSVSEIRGSIAGSTYQRNASGTIIKAKNNQRFSSSNSQSLAQQRLSQVATLWNSLEPGQRDDWNSWASLFSRTDFYGRVKSLSGFQWFQLCNNNLQQLGLPMIPDTEGDASPIAVPLLAFNFDATHLTIDFSSPVDMSLYFMVVYMSAPCASIVANSRIPKLFIKSFTGSAVEHISIFDEYQAIYGNIWAGLTSNPILTVQTNVFTIRKDNGISSQYRFESIFPGA